MTHAAITENKHLSAVLEHIKAEQDKAPLKKRRAYMNCATGVIGRTVDQSEPAWPVP